MKKTVQMTKEMLLTIVILMMSVFCMNLQVNAGENHPLFFVDDAGLLSQSEAAEVEERLTEISNQYGMDVVIYTVYDSTIISPMAEADDYFDENGFGQGADRSGLVLYINMSTRDWWISTRGEAISAFTDAGLDYIGEQIVEDLGNGYYADACMNYAELCEKFIRQAREGKPYDVGNMPRGLFPLFSYLGTSILIGCVIGGILIICLKSQLKSVAPNNSATDYVVKGSMNITESRERFLYRNVTSVRKQEDSSSSGGGSSTHRSSSGASHGGRGGKF